MARAKRPNLPGQVGHLTHRGHNKQLLLKFVFDPEKDNLGLFSLNFKTVGRPHRNHTTSLLAAR